jgi:hypothetical protein
MGQSSSMSSRGQDVVDFIAYMEHIDWIMGLCDTVSTSHSIYKCFKSDNMFSVERGQAAINRSTRPRKTVSLEQMTTIWDAGDQIPFGDDLIHFGSIRF